jgi:hypothetical protein
MSEFPDTQNLQGNDIPEKEFPIASLRDFLLPSQAVSVSLFEADSIAELENQINGWVKDTGNIVAIPSTVSKSADGKYMIAISFVEAG